MSDFERQHLVDKQRGLCASCRLRLPADFCVRRNVYPDEIAVSYAQCPACHRGGRPRRDGYVPGTPLDAFFSQFSPRLKKYKFVSLLHG